MLAMNLNEALKNGLVVEVEDDKYLLDDGRCVVYDRYIRSSNKWICDDGRAYRNFFEVCNREFTFSRPISYKLYVSKFGDVDLDMDKFEELFGM